MEDTIFCNNRVLLNKGGWEKNGTLSNGYQYFRDYNENAKSLDCPNQTDRFSINNHKAKLKYSIGLMTAPEYRLLGTKNFMNYTTEWTMTPYWQDDGYILIENGRYNGGSIYSDFVTDKLDVRPVISLKPNIQYKFGNGSSDLPYHIRMIDDNNIMLINDEKKGIIDIPSLENIPSGSVVKLIIKPSSGYDVDKLIVKDEEDKDIDYKKTSKNNYEFIMPDTDVTIKPIYKKAMPIVNPKTGSTIILVILGILTCLGIGTYLLKKKRI